MIHYFYGTLHVGIGQTLCSFEHVSCSSYYYFYPVAHVLSIDTEIIFIDFSINREHVCDFLLVISCNICYHRFKGTGTATSRPKISTFYWTPFLRNLLDHNLSYGAHYADLIEDRIIPSVASNTDNGTKELYY